jgi:dephospho-CoA kinase
VRVLGLTGGIGSGKSAVARMLAELGAEIVDADRLAREVDAPGSERLAEIVSRFGSAVLDPRGELDRRALGRIVFNDEEARRDLNRIVHPRVAARTAEEIQARTSRGAKVVVYDIPLLY